MDHLAKLYYNKAVALTEEIKVLEKKLKDLQEGGGPFNIWDHQANKARAQVAMKTPSKAAETTVATVGTPRADVAHVAPPAPSSGLPGVLTAAALIGAGIYGAKKMFGANTGLTSKRASPLASPLPDAAPTGVAAEVSHIPSPFVDSESGKAALSRQNLVSKWGTPANSIKRPTVPSTMDFIKDITPDTTTAAQMMDVPVWDSKTYFYHTGKAGRDTTPMGAIHQGFRETTPDAPKTTPETPVASKPTPTAVKNNTPPKDPGRTPDLWDNLNNDELKAGAAEAPKVDFKGNPIAAEPPVAPAPAKAVSKLKGAEVNKSIAKTGVAKASRGAKLVGAAGAVAGQIGASVAATDAAKLVSSDETDQEVASTAAALGSLKLAGPTGLAVGAGVLAGKGIDAAVEASGIGDIQRSRATKVAMAANKLLGNSGPSTEKEATASALSTKSAAKKARATDIDKGFSSPEEAAEFAQTQKDAAARTAQVNAMTRAANAKLGITAQALQNTGHNGDALDIAAGAVDATTNAVNKGIGKAIDFTKDFFK